METIKIKYFYTNDKHGERISVKEISQTSYGNWIDLRALIENESYSYQTGEHIMIPLGVAMKLPDGYEAHIVPRSSTFKNYGLIMTNHMGVIDNSYSGNEDQWLFSAFAYRSGIIHHNDRICQFRIMKSQPSLLFLKTDYLEGDNRGGFGSTGVK